VPATDRSAYAWNRPVCTSTAALRAYSIYPFRSSTSNQYYDCWSEFQKSWAACAATVLSRTIAGDVSQTANSAGICRAVQVLPEAPADLISELSRRYILLYETITGQTFQPAPLDESPAERMQRNVARALQSL